MLICLCVSALVVLAMATASVSGQTPSLAAFDEATLRQADLPTDAAGLLAVLRGFLRTDADSKKIATLIAQLGSPQFDQREQATAALIAIGRPAVEALRKAQQEHPDTEVRRRAEHCLAAFDRMLDPAISMSVVRRLLHLRAAGSAELLLQLLPDADWEIQDEIFFGLQRVALPAGKLDPALLTALSDKSALRRAAAALTVALVGNGDECLRVRKLLNDCDPEVRLRAAQGLLAVHDESSLPVLIALLNERNEEISWSAEELLHWVALKNVPKETVQLTNASERKKVVEAWRAWRKSEAGKIEWLQVEAMPRRPMLFTAWAEQKHAWPINQVWLGGCDGRRAPSEVLSCLNPIMFGGTRRLQTNFNIGLPTNTVDSLQLKELDPRSKALQIPDFRTPCNIEVICNGHYLLSVHTEKRIVELDAGGRTQWEFYPGEKVTQVCSIFDKVRIGFDKPRPPDFDLDSAANRVRGLKDADAEVRRRSAVFLNFIKPTDPASLEALASALDDKSDQVREVVTSTLKEIGQPAVPFLVRTLTQGSTLSRKAALCALKEMDMDTDAKAATDALLAIAMSPKEEPVLREYAVQVLSRSNANPTLVAAPLLELLKDAELPDSLRSAAAHTLGRLAAAVKPRPPGFDELLFDPELPHSHAIALLKGLATAKGGEAALTELVTQGERTRRCLAIQLCSHPDLETVALPALKLAKKDPDRLISVVAAIAVYNIDTRKPNYLQHLPQYTPPTQQFPLPRTP